MGAEPASRHPSILAGREQPSGGCRSRLARSARLFTLALKGGLSTEVRSLGC
jgi:hypothetical protein